MIKKPDIWKWLAPLALLLATACGHDDVLPPDVYVEETTPYVELRIAIPFAQSLTRGNPMGGEEGNGREEGVLHEDEVHDINVFFYVEGKDPASGKGLGMDSPDNTLLIKHIYYNLDNDGDSENTPQVKVDDSNGKNPDGYYFGYVSLQFECTEQELETVKTTGLNFVAIANAGKLQYTEDMTLKKLRDLHLSYHSGGTGSWTTTLDAYSVDATKMNYFLMSTAYNKDSRYGENKLSPSGNNYTGTTTLQRLYARLDLWYNQGKNAVAGENDKVKELKYGLVDADGKEIVSPSAHVYITNVLPVNVMKDPSYLFKKVTAEEQTWTPGSSVWNLSSLTSISSFSWGGKESPNDLPVSNPDLPKNYVMEWHTKSKLEGGKSPIDSLNAWYGKTAKSEVLKNINVNNTETSKDGHFSAYYHMNRSAAENDPTDYDCNHISIIGYANENTHPTDCFHSNYLTGLAFRAVYVPEKIYTAYTTTSSTNAEGKVVTTTSFQELDQTLDTFEGLQIFRYSPTEKVQSESTSLYFTSKDVAEAYAYDHPLDMAIISGPYAATKHTLEDGTSKKWGFICYYNLWLRHYNNEAADPQATYPMEYATVRNNIYRVAVSFKGPGDPTPTMREPDTMKARIFVRKWNYKEEPTIDFDL